MIKITFRILLVVALVFNAIWISKDGEWESYISFITLFSSFLFSEYKNYSLSNISKADIELFQKFKEDIPYSAIDFIKNYSLQSPFNDTKLDPFFNFIEPWKNVHHTFQDKKLEKLKCEFHKNIDTFTDLVNENVFDTNRPGIKCIPKEWSYDRPTQYKVICTKLSKSQDSVVNNYNKLIKISKKRLKL
jgi:hypothetical protein